APTADPIARSSSETEKRRRPSMPRIRLSAKGRAKENTAKYRAITQADHRWVMPKSSERVLSSGAIRATSRAITIMAMTKGWAGPLLLGICYHLRALSLLAGEFSADAHAVALPSDGPPSGSRRISNR